MKKDVKFIKQVASDAGISKLTDKDVNRAHKAASKAGKADYYYALKEFFNN